MKGKELLWPGASHQQQEEEGKVQLVVVGDDGASECRAQGITKDQQPPQPAACQQLKEEDGEVGASGVTEFRVDKWVEIGEIGGWE